MFGSSPTRSHPHHRSLTLIVATALAASAALGADAASAAVTPDAAVVIDEVYGGGGNSGAAFNRDFIELYNRSAAAVDLSGWSVQYSSASGATWQTTPLGSVTLAAGASLLVGQAVGAATTLPGFTADVDGSIAMSGSGGKVALVSSTVALSGASGTAARAEVVDFVGWGAATDWTGTGAAPATTNATSVARTAHATTANNAADFRAGPPTPTGTGGGEPEPPGEPVDATIAEVQGTGAASPLVGQNVRTTGVVTAHYAVGGFNGFVIQTPGTGGDLELASHTASDAVFVYAPSQVGAVELGDSVEVTGAVSEFNGLTEITLADGGLRDLPAASAPTPARVAWPAGAIERESLESMLIAPAGDYTVADTYATNQYGEVKLAFGTAPLRQPTDVARPGSAEAAAVVADNAARAVTLDDGQSTDFLKPANSALTPAYVSLDEPIRVGAHVTFDEPLVLDYRNNAWKLTPTTPVVGDGTGADGVTFENTRTTAPDAVGGDVSVASYNVLNYFTTLGVESSSCVPYRDRAGNGIAVADGCDQRGAWDAASLTRQQDKTVAAITALDASVVGLMEIENSARLGEAPDEALASLVAALNDHAGTARWDYVRSPSNLPDASSLDVITNAIIYQPALVTAVGASVALADQSGDDQAFGNAREPIAQAFAPSGGGEAFTVVVNHFKSKGSVGPWPGDADRGDGQGTSVESRVRQATALRDWVATNPTGTASDDVYLVGDFNSYGQEDPMQVLYEAGYVDAEAAFEVEEATYVFQGLSGSLDHVLMNAGARERATGAATWQINSVESLALEYSRYNYHGTLFWAPDAYRASDHDPVKVGVDALATTPQITAGVATRCTGKKGGAKMMIDVAVTNDGPRTIDIDVATPYGTRTLADVAPGSTAKTTINTKALSISGLVTVTAHDDADAAAVSTRELPVSGHCS